MSNGNYILNKPVRSDISVDDFKTAYTVFTSIYIMYNTSTNMSLEHPANLELTILMFLASNFFVQRNNRYNPEFGIKLQRWVNSFSWTMFILMFFTLLGMTIHFIHPMFQFLITWIGGVFTIIFTLYTRGKSLSFDEVQVALSSLVEELYKNFPDIIDNLSEDIENNGGLKGDYGKKVINALKTTTKEKTPTDHKAKKKHKKGRN